MADTETPPQQEFNRLYSDVAASIASATAAIDLLEVEHTSGKKEVGGIVERLRAMQARFDDELALLEEHAEWEKFTIAFFGETNAGKSTIIESLRILFDEQSRRRLLEQNAADLQRYQQELDHHSETVRRGFAEALAAFAADVAAIRGDFEARANAILDSTGAQALAARQELAAVARALEKETAARATAETALAAARRNTWIAAIAGCVAGGALLGLLTLVLH